MNAIEISLPDLAATEQLAARVAALARPGDAILLAGPLGAGKTAFARAFLRAATGDRRLEVPSPGWDEARGDIVLVEWPDRLGSEAPEDALTITLTLGVGEARHATLAGWPNRIGRLA